MAVPTPHEAIEALYRAFAHRRRPSALDASAAKDPAVVAKLLAMPLREVDPDAILRYSGWALTTVGTEEDFAHFLPRILEVAIEGPAAGLSELFIIAGKLEPAGWQSWSEAERAAVSGAFQSAFARLRAVDPDEEVAFPWLEAMMRAGIDLRPALEGWLAEPGSAPLLQLADCLVNLARGVENGTREGYRADVLRDLIAWFTTGAAETALFERADEISPDRSYLLDMAVDAISTLAAASEAETPVRS